MAQVRTGQRMLDPYEATSNLQRSRQIGSEPGVAPADHPAGLTVAILNLNRPDLLLPLLDRMGEASDAFAVRGLGFEVVVGDTGSTDPAVLARYAAGGGEPWLRVVRGLDYHFSRCNNECVAAAPTGFDTVLLVNNDVVFPSSDSLVQMFDELHRRIDVAVVGLRMLYPDGTVQHPGIDIVRSGFRRGLPWHPTGGLDPAPGSGGGYPAIAVTGACLMVRRAVWDAVGGLDPTYSSECQDVDLCLAARRLGHEVLVVDAGPVVHLEGATRGADDESAADRRVFLRRWASYLEANYL